VKIALLTPKWSWYCHEVMENFVKYVDRPDYKFDIIHSREITKRLQRYDWILSYIRFQETYASPLFDEIRHKFIAWNSGMQCYDRITDWSIFRYVFLKSKSLIQPQLGEVTCFVQPSGVDAEFYKPMDMEKKWLTIFIGKATRDPKVDHKQVFKLFIPACEAAGVIYHVHDALEKMLPREELVPLYNQSQTYMCTSSWEGGPQPLLEAGACGLALISSRVGYAEHGLIDGNGFICDGFDEFVEALRYCDEHPRETERMGRRSRELILRDWHWKVQAENLISRIEGLT